MITQQTRQDIWDERLDVARLVRYYEKLSDKQRHYYFVIRGMLVLSAFSGAAALLKFFPENIQEEIAIVAGFVIALVTAWDILTNYARKAAVSHAIGKECSFLEIEWKDLWADANNHLLEDPVARKKNRRLARRITEVTAWAGYVNIREDRKLNEKCENEVHRIMGEKYVS